MGNLGLLLISLRMPEPERQEADHKQPSILRVMGILFQNPDYAVFVACYFLGVVAATPVNTFYPMYITQLGGTQAHLGAGYFLMALAEVPMLLLYQRLEARFGNRLLLTFGLAGIGLRSVFIALAPTPVMAVLAMLSQALAYGFIIPGVVGFISRNVEHRYSSSALLVATALGVSLSQILTNLVSGFVAQAIGMRSMMLLLLALFFWPPASGLHIRSGVRDKLKKAPGRFFFPELFYL
jgi:PPP family 3-phenylpropionic acid transporter